MIIKKKAKTKYRKCSQKNTEKTRLISLLHFMHFFLELQITDTGYRLSFHFISEEPSEKTPDSSKIKRLTL